jgi:hypothetical protein
MAILKVLPNKPLTLSLKFPLPIEKQGKWGLQYLYTLSEPDALIYLPPIAHDEIQKLHAGPGEPFILTKSIGQGNQAQWKVERIQQPSAPANVSKPERPVEVQNGPIAPKSSTNGKVPAIMQAPEVLQTRQSKAMAKQLIAAIDAGIAAIAYAKSQNFPLELTSRDICAIAISGSIQQFREGVY